MISVPLYLARRLTHRIFEFLEDWYIESFYFVYEKTLNILRLFDGTLALVVTIRHFAQPLYQDKTIIGYILGFIFRAIRILIAVVVYTILILFIGALYLVWLSVPIYVLYKAISGLIL
jgi:hypothetical protein